MVFSCFLSYLFSYLVAKFVKKSNFNFKKGLYVSCASLSFMHGAQDGQKFIAIMMFLLGMSENGHSRIPLSLIFVVSTVMCLSTMLGGKKIIDSLSKSIDNLDTPLAFLSDMSSFVTLLICSLLGMPISTGNVRSLSIVGSARAKKVPTNKKMITEILMASVITFPICFLIGFIFCKVFNLCFL